MKAAKYYFSQSLTALNLLNIVLIILAALCFLPQIIGYHFLTDFFPDGQTSLPGPMFSYSLIASIAATTPLLLENFTDFLTKFYFNQYDQSSDNEISYFKFPSAVLVMVIFTDLLLLNYIIPNQKFDFLPGLICCRDILFTWSFLVNVHRLGSSVWTLPKISFIIFCSVSLNWIYAWMSMSETAAASSDLLNIQYALISSMIFALLVFTAMWFHHIYTTNNENLDFKTILMNMQTSVFAVFLCMYIVADFTPGLAASTEPSNWAGYGESYLTMLTYMMAGCVLCVNVITTSISKIGSLEISKVLYFDYYLFYHFLMTFMFYIRNY